MCELDWEILDTLSFLILLLSGAIAWGDLESKISEKDKNIGYAGVLRSKVLNLIPNKNPAKFLYLTVYKFVPILNLWIEQ